MPPLHAEPRIQLGLNRFWIWEVIALAALMGGLVWTHPPDVNEAHYLAKARHFWDQSFCQNDIFITSFDTHWAFYLTHGWLFPSFGFEVGTWVGRCIAWTVIAWGLVLLSRTFWDKVGFSLLAGGLVVLLNENLNLAGEWFVGGVEGKCYAYGFGFAALAYWFRNNTPRALVLMGLACAFHIVVGLWLVLATGFAWFWELWKNRPASTENAMDHKRRLLLAIPLAFVFFLVGFVPAVLQNAAASQVDISVAAQAQSLWRLSHHQLATEFDRWFLYLPVSGIWLFLAICNRNQASRNLKRLNRVVVASLLIAIGGLVLALVVTWLRGSFKDFAALLLTLYWFRLADVLVPLGCVFNAFYFIDHLPRELRLWRLAVVFSIGFLTWGFVLNLQQNQRDPRSGSAQQTVLLPSDPQRQRREIEAEINWVKTCDWIRDNTPPDALFVTPLNQQTFKWYAQRSEVASRKDMPQDAKSILPWLERLSVLFSIGPDESRAESGLNQAEIPWEYRPLLLRESLPFGANYLVIEQRWVNEFQRYQPLPAFLKQVYPVAEDRKSTFVVFQQVDIKE